MAIKTPEISNKNDSAAPKKLLSFLGANYDIPLSKCGSVGVRCCRLCNSYKFTGRSSGQCQTFNSEVKGSWKGCPVGVPMFST